MKISVVFGAITLAVSLFFIFYVMGAVVAINVNCTGLGRILQCNFNDLGIPVISGLSFVGGFVLIDSLIIYIIFRGWINMEKLRRRLSQIDSLKETAEKEYYKKKIDERSFTNLIQSYDKELVELEVKLRKLK